VFTVARKFAVLLHRYPLLVLALLVAAALVASVFGKPHGLWDGPI